MNEEERVKIEYRLAVLEAGIQHVKQNSDDRLLAIMNRFDKQDRLAGMLVSAAFTVCLAMGGIYLEAYINKEEHTHLEPVVARVDSDDGL